jgi:hypothetical protein
VREADLTAFQREWGNRNWAEARGTAAAAPDQFDLVVRGMPWLITSGLEGASVLSVKRREAAELSRPSLYLQ